VIFTDELNHASIIDAVRLSRPAEKVIYPHSDMAKLRDGLAGATRGARKLVVTDGVFSMEGDLARLPEIVELAREFEAVVIVDDSHGVGVLGETGRGVVEHFGLLGEVDVLTGTLGKALGGAAGGYVAASDEVCDLLQQRSRPQLFSNALPPTVACSALRAIELMLEEPDLLARLRENTTAFRAMLVDAGYRPLEGESAIIPIIVGETADAIALSQRLLEDGVFVTGFGFPVVPEGTARIRVQMSAALEPEHLERAIEAFRRVRPS
jgi:glycine C-acetyltransferase